MVRRGRSTATGAATAAPSMSDFTSTFVLSSLPGTEQGLLEVPKALGYDPSRQRRAHRKSRNGCESCRKQRIKCDGETPCSRCARRKERCRRPVPHTVEPAPSDMPASALLPDLDAAVNLMHLKLFHHFQECTRQTLLFPEDVWHRTLQLCFHYEFLMNAVLSVGARHLATLQPEDPTYPTAATSHLCRALSGFRQELSGDFASMNADAFVATSTLLQYEIWATASSDMPPCTDAMGFDPSRDRIFAFSSVLKTVFLKSVPMLSAQSSVLLPHMRVDMGDKLAEAVGVSNRKLGQYQDFFSYHRPIKPDRLHIPLSSDQDGDNVPVMQGPWVVHPEKSRHISDPKEAVYAPVIARLCVILSFLPEAGSRCLVDTASPLFPVLARYIFCFPVTCCGPFAALIQNRDPHALLMLYHFYRAARILLPPSECWWAHERAAVSEVLLKDWLAGESAKQVELSRVSSVSHASSLGFV
ncbi:hypothetical protein GQ53DRAFT_845159 [Thozetella sp. PMI_491]|nr:hypothetical protein GQ53DRAFT_845159 [Thozetella sp. PMI_491]